MNHLCILLLLNTVPLKTYCKEGRCTYNLITLTLRFYNVLIIEFFDLMSSKCSRGVIERLIMNGSEVPHVTLDAFWDIELFVAFKHFEAIHSRNFKNNMWVLVMYCLAMRMCERLILRSFIAVVTFLGVFTRWTE